METTQNTAAALKRAVTEKAAHSRLKKRIQSVCLHKDRAKHK